MSIAGNKDHCPVTLDDLRSPKVTGLLSTFPTIDLTKSN